MRLLAIALSLLVLTGCSPRFMRGLEAGAARMNRGIVHNNLQQNMYRREIGNFSRGCRRYNKSVDSHREVNCTGY